jgi:predicted AAA+ superfamily ATPase
LSELSLYGKELERLFKDYLLTGGTPRVINEFLSKVAIPESAYRTFLDVVLGDLAKWNKRESYLRQITRRIIETLGSPVSWNTLKDETDIAHHQTVSEYVDTLRDTFVLLPFYYLDISRGEPDYRKEKRIHFHDPFFLHALRAWVSGSSPYESSLEYMKQGSNVGLLSEGAVADHLVRLAFGLAEQRQLFEYENRVFYWKSHKGREVDFVLRLDNKRYLPIEVKFRRTIRKEDRMGVLDFSKTGLAKGGLILSQNILEAKDRIVTLPVWLFLILA